MINFDLLQVERKSIKPSTPEHLHPPYNANQLAPLLLIHELQEPLQQIPHLYNAPIFKAVEVVLTHFLESPPSVNQPNTPPDSATITLTHLRNPNSSPTSPGKDTIEQSGLFDFIWDFFTRLSQTDSDIMKRTLKIFSTWFTHPGTAPYDLFHNIFAYENEMARQDPEHTMGTITRVGGDHELNQTLEVNTPFEQGLALQRSLFHYIRHIVSIQSTWAGSFLSQPPNTWSQEQASQQQDSARALFTRLSSPTTLAEILPDSPLLSTLQQDTSRPIVNAFASHDPANIFAESGALTAIPMEYENNFLAFRVRLFSSDGQHYSDLSANQVLNLNSATLIEYLRDHPTAPGLNWHPTQQLPRDFPHFCLSFSPAQIDPQLDAIRGNDGDTITHLHLEGRQLRSLPGHLHLDGQEHLEIFHDLIKMLNPLPELDSVSSYLRIHPSYSRSADPNSPESKLEQLTGLTDVELGFTLPDQLDTLVYNINQKLALRHSSQITALLNSPTHLPTVDHILSLYHLQPNTENRKYLIKSAVRLLSPRLSRSHLLGLLSERQGPTVNCVGTHFAHNRLNLAAFATTEPQLLARILTTNQPNPKDMESILDAIMLSLADQSLSRLGLNPNSFIANFTIKIRSLATKLAEYFSPQALAKTQTLTQISELKHGLADWFVSAKSRFRDVARSIGLINHHITYRFDFSAPAFLDTFNPFLFHPELGTATLDEVLTQIKNLDHQHHFSDADYASARTVHARILMRLRHTPRSSFSQILLGAFPPGVSASMHPEGKRGLQIYLLAMAHNQSVQLHEDALTLARRLDEYLSPSQT